MQCKCPGKLINCPPLNAVSHDHRGTHPAFLEEVVHIDGGRMWMLICQIFLRRLLEVKPVCLRDLEEFGVAVLFICDWGKHRSVAACYLLLWCLLNDNWNVEPQWRQLNRNFQSRKLCGWKSCEDCDIHVNDAQGRCFEEALDIFQRAYQQII